VTNWPVMVIGMCRYTPVRITGVLVVIVVVKLRFFTKYTVGADSSEQ